MKMRQCADKGHDLSRDICAALISDRGFRGRCASCRAPLCATMAASPEPRPRAEQGAGGARGRRAEQVAGRASSDGSGGGRPGPTRRAGRWRWK